MRHLFSILMICALAEFSTESFAQRTSPFPSKTPPWSQRWGDEGRRNRTFAPGPDQGTLAWKVQTNGLVPSLAVNGFGQAILGVYFVDEAWSGESYFGALSTGGDWDVRLKVAPYPWGSSQGVDSGPGLSANNTLFFNSGNGQVRRYSPTFDLQQTIQRSGSATNDSAPAVLADGTIFHYQIIGGLIKYSRHGNAIWSAGVTSLRNDVAVAPNGDSAMGGVRTTEPHGSTDLTYVNANGTRRWTLTSTRGSNHQPMFGPDGSLYYGGTKYNTVSGAVIWASGAGTAPMTHGWRPEIYCATTNVVTAVSASTGAVIWSVAIANPIQINNGMALDGRGFLYLTTRSGRLVKLESTNGAIVFDRQIASEIRSGPVIGADRSAFFTVREGFTNYVAKVL